MDGGKPRVDDPPETRSPTPHAEAFVRAAPDIIYASPATAVGGPRLTTTIPVVFTQSGDPVQAGTVQSMVRPGGNITGFVQFEPSMNMKYVQLLKDISPQLTRVGVADKASAARGGSDCAAIAQAARSLSMTAIELPVRDDPADIEHTIVGFAQAPAAA